MHQNGAATASISSYDHAIYAGGAIAQRVQGDLITISSILSAQTPRIIQWRGHRIGAEHSIATGIVRSRPQHFGIDTTAYQMQQCRGAEGSAELCLVKARSNTREVMRMRIPLSTDVEN